MESISSKNTTHGDACLARLNISLIPRSDSPTHFDSNSGPRTETKFASLSVATAFASKVFPTPLGPCNSIPLGILWPSLSYSAGYFIGHSTASWSCCFTSLRPPMSSHFTSGFSMNTSRIPDGVTSMSAFWKSSLFTMSLSSVSGGSFSSSMFSSGNSLLRHFIAASLHRYSKSAPT